MHAALTFYAYYTQLNLAHVSTIYNAQAPTTPAIAIAPRFLATFATAAPVETADAAGDAWNVAVALGMTLLDRLATLVEVEIKLDGTVRLFVGVITGML